MKNHFPRFKGSRTIAGDWLIALLLGGSQLAAQPVLVKDINPGQGQLRSDGTHQF